MTRQNNCVPVETESTDTVLLNQNTDSVAIPVEANNYSYPRYPIYVKAIVLASLALHHAGGILFMSYVRKQTDSRFINSVVVFICEIQKTILSLILIFGEERSLIGGLKTIYNKIILQPKDTLKMLIPAVIYTIQNNLNLQAITVLDPAILVVFNQFKIFTTAIFTSIMLRRRLGLIQWFALVILFLGITIVEIGRSKPTTSKGYLDKYIGLLLAISACICSGLAGVYFEKVLKGSNVSLWIRELQLAGLSMFCSPIAVFILNREDVKERGLLDGFTQLVWAATIVRSVGGLLVALVIKYADNILKGFASSSAIVLTSIISVIFFKFQITYGFVVGSLLVIFSIFLYSKPDLVLHVPIINSLIKNKPIFFESKK